MDIKKRRPDMKYITGLSMIALCVFPYIFNPQLDVNGDNCLYYINATSLANGNGYCDMFGNPTANFPPGYPLIMTPLRLITPSFTAQKVMNLLFLFGGSTLLYLLLKRQGIRRELAFIVSAAVLTTPHLLEFATMMMSEASCIFFIILSFWHFNLIPDERKGECIWRSRHLYLFLAATLFSLYIRTQAIALAAAFVIGLAASRRWKISLAVATTTVLGYLPWIIRNMIHGLDASRYTDQISFVSIGAKLKMLLVQALPESMAPYFNVDYTQAPSLLLWAISIGILGISAYGTWRLEKFKNIIYTFLTIGLGMIATMNTPSLYRYLAILLPLFTTVFLIGLWHIADKVSARLLKRNFSPWFMVLLLLPGVAYGGNGIFKHTLKDLNSFSKQEYPTNYTNLFRMGHSVHTIDPNTIVVSRKPELLYVTEGVKGIQFKKTTDEVEFMRHLILEEARYVIVDDTGFSSTGNYLVKFIIGNKELFTIKDYTEEPHTFLFQFERDKARAWLKSKGY